MSTAINFALGNTLMACVFAALAILVSQTFKRPALTHAMWLLVLVKLVTPPLWTLPIHVELSTATKPTAPPLISVHQEVEASPISSELTIETIQMERVATPTMDRSTPDARFPLVVVPQRDSRVPISPSADAEEISPPLNGLPAKSTSIAPEPEQPWSLRWPGFGVFLLVIAAIGTIFCTLVIAIRLARFQRLLRYAADASPEVQHLTETLAGRMGVQMPSVSMVPGAICPMVFSLGGKPRILIPDVLWRRLDSVQQSALLMHELAHLHRRDHWVRWLEIVVTVLYWWHPAVWWARRELREAEEQCCDAWVVWMMPGSNRPYSAALLEAMDFVSVPSPAASSQAIGSSQGYSMNRKNRIVVPAWASGMGQFNQLRRRLIMIKTAQVSRRLSWTGLSSVFVLGGLLLPVAPGLAQVSTKTAEQPVPALKPANETRATPESAPSVAEEPNGNEGQSSRREESEDVLKLNPPKPESPRIEPTTVRQPAVYILSQSAPSIPAEPAEPPSADSRPATLLLPTPTTPVPPAISMQMRMFEGAASRAQGQAQDRELQVARAEIQALSAKLQSASKRLQDLEKVQAENRGASMKMVPTQNNADVFANRAGSDGKGPYQVIRTPDGRVETYSPDGKLISSMIAPDARKDGYALPPVDPTAQTMPVPMRKSRGSDLASGVFGGGAPNSGPVEIKQTHELADRLQKLEADMQSMTQELRSLHKEISVGRNGNTLDAPNALQR